MSERSFRFIIQFFLLTENCLYYSYDFNTRYTHNLLLAICRPNDRTVTSGVVGFVVVVVVVGVCNRSQMRTSKYICLIFGVSIGLDPG